MCLKYNRAYRCFVWISL